MLSPFQRLVEFAKPRPALRSRLAQTKARFAAARKRAGRAISGAKDGLRPEPSLSADAIQRIALVNYSTWLDFERRHVCQELYPGMGRRCISFLLTANAAEKFFFPAGYGGERKSNPANKPAPASTRAVLVLDMVGVAWRSDLTKHGQDHLAREQDSPWLYKEPVPPHGWPRADAALLEALDDLARLDAGLTAMLGAGDQDRDGDTVPGYEDLDFARDQALARLTKEEAESLVGLQVKARALLMRSVQEFHDEEFKHIAASLARDLLHAHPRKVEPQPDPTLALIDEAWRLVREHGRLLAVCGTKPSDDPAWQPEHEAHDAMWEHVRGVLLKTVPRTAEGCKALARFVVEFNADQGVPVEYDSNDPVFDLIARSPLL